MHVDDVHEMLLKDRVFYETSEGGVTLSGGEPMFQHRFLRELLPRLQDGSIHTCVETCGFGPMDVFLELAPMIDLFLWDVKHTDPEQHLRLTGRSNERILDNLRAIDALGSHVWLRCVLMKDVNMNADHLEELEKLVKGLRNCERIDLLPYHAYGLAKAESLGIRQQRYEVPSVDEMEWARRYLAQALAG
jgi:pyruvate formate lyase activating enzyme